MSAHSLPFIYILSIAHVDGVAGKPCAGKSHARFDEGGLASQPRCGYLGAVRRKGRKQISQPKAVIASSLLCLEFP
jgi:hypothetical protein